MRIAVALDDFQTVADHAGGANEFRIFEANGTSAPRELEPVALEQALAYHEQRGTDPHPLKGMDVIICGGACNGFVSRMAMRGITAVTTPETDPVAAVRDFVSGTLARSEPSESCDDHHH